ncbi:UNVERIFIED_CONTAM: NVEALA domain-containing protein, partial [Bacteroidetes bacterium 56_B9]
MLGVLFVLIILVSYMAKPEKTQNDLLLMNIEALAAGENYVPIQCIGTGTVDCPLGG